MNYSVNGIDYVFEQLEDKWIAIYEIAEGKKIPKIQAKNIEKAKEYCDARELTNIKPRRLIEEG